MPLFNSFWENAKQEDFNIDNYPIVFFENAGIREIRINTAVRQELGARLLPEVIIEEIKKSGCKNALDFIDYLEEKDMKKKSAPVMDRRPEMQAFQIMLEGDDLQHTLLLMVGQPGQGKTLLMNQFAQMSIEQDISHFKIDLTIKVELKDILDAIWQRLGAHNFPLYSAQRGKSGMFQPPSATKQQDELTKSFFLDWEAIDENSRFVLLLDTYENASRGLQNWIENVFLEELPKIHHAIVVIGGRKRPKTSEYWDSHCHRYPLEGVQLRDYKKYAVHRGYKISDIDLEKLHKAMSGIPKLFKEYIDGELQMRA